MFTVIIGIAAFTSIALILTLVIMGAEARLVQKGSARITINDDPEKALEVAPGKTLLATLSQEKIFLPSACGGGGTCGTCKCRVIEGGGDILPIELNHISRKMAREGWRLSCQVKIRGDMAIRVPEEIFSIRQWECEVLSNNNVATFIKEFVVKLPEGMRLDFQAGGYIQIEIPAHRTDFGRDIEVRDERFRGEWERLHLFDMKVKNPEPCVRAYSMANHPAEGNIIKLNVRIATPPWNPKKRTFINYPPGYGSSYIFSRKPGDRVLISGPYGEFFIQDTDREMIYIGGGAGMAPMRSHIFHLFHTLKTKRKVSYWYGARSKMEIFYEKEFRDIERRFKNFSFHVALSEPQPEDRWKGYTGFIHQVVLDEYLSNHPYPEDIEYYLCGPPMMLEAVQRMLHGLGVEPEMVRFDDFG